MDRFTETDPMNYADGTEPGGDWNDRDEECTCRFTGDRADASGCFAHGAQSDYSAVALEATREVARKDAGVRQYDSMEKESA